MSLFKKATKAAAKLRLAIYGPSGSGKTYSALRIAKGMGGKIAVIDTEHGSASKYADRFDFDVADLDDKSIKSYVSTINAACGAGYNVLIIDSLTHGWQELLESIDRIAKSSRHKGNRWSAWSEATPEQRRLVDAILECKCHVIATMRTKTEWIVEENGGKSKPTKVGLAPEQGKGIEYEFDMLMEISPDHIATVTKDRTGKFQDSDITKPDEAFGKSLIDWLQDGAAPSPDPKPKKQPAGEIDKAADEAEKKSDTIRDKKKFDELQEITEGIGRFFATTPNSDKWVALVKKEKRTDADLLQLLRWYIYGIADGDGEKIPEACKAATGFDGGDSGPVYMSSPEEIKEKMPQHPKWLRTAYGKAKELFIQHIRDLDTNSGNAA